MDERDLWRDMIVSKCGSWRNIDQGSRNNSESKWWRDLGGICRKCDEGKWFHECLSWRVGKGNKIYVWDDCCYGEAPLNEVFPRIYENSTQKGLKLAKCGKWQGRPWKWKLCWRRAWFEWKKPMLEEILKSIQWCVIN